VEVETGRTDNADRVERFSRAKQEEPQACGSSGFSPAAATAEGCVRGRRQKHVTPMSTNKNTDSHKSFRQPIARRTVLKSASLKKSSSHGPAKRALGDRAIGRT
jgi:hypothetical protein